MRSSYSESLLSSCDSLNCPFRYLAEEICPPSVAAWSRNNVARDANAQAWAGSAETKAANAEWML
jgi:hypothetical protein